MKIESVLNGNFQKKVDHHRALMDGSIRQNMIKGRSLPLPSICFVAGFQTMSEIWPNQRMDAVLQQMFPNSLADEDVQDVTSLTETYHKYKREYVQQLLFDPEDETLSKYSP